MSAKKQRRNRGIILTRSGWQKLQNTLLDWEFQENHGNKFTLEEISDRTQLTTATLRKTMTREEGVDKQTLVRLFMAFDLDLTPDDYTKPDPSFSQEEEISLKHIEWGDAPDISFFCGRTVELTRLEKWLLGDRCRVITILGMGGIGKTSLASKLGQKVKNRFDCVIWQSLRDAPPLKELLAKIIQFLSSEAETCTDLPESINERIALLIAYLRSQRCLLVLDNLESVLCPDSRAGVCREGYEEYSELFKQIGQQDHQSCLLLTTREKPKEIAALEGETFPVRTFRLCGLQGEEGEIILKQKGLVGTESEFKALVEYYGGNALALKIVATTIRDLFAGDITAFLQSETVVFGDIRDLLDQQFKRLTFLEQEIIYWLAINREQTNLSELREDMVTTVPQLNLMEGLESLSRRSLIEQNGGCFTLQSVVMEYVICRLIERVCQEIDTQTINFFHCYALMKATAKDYIRETQIRLILQPIIDGLLAIFRCEQSIEERLTKILATQRETAPRERGYTAGNIINLFCQMETDIKGYDFSNLCVWQADLRNAVLHDVNFQNADLTKSVFAETFSGIISVAFSPDGKLLATGDMNGEIRLYRVADWKQLLTFKGHTDWVSSVSFSPDSSILATASLDRAIKLWEVNTFQCLRILQEHDHGIWSVAFSPDGKMLASGSDDRRIKFWDVSTGKCLKTLEGHNGWVRAVIFNPESQILISGSHDRSIKLWDLSTGECLRTLEGHDDGIWFATLSPDGQMLASASKDKTVKLWDISTGECLKTLRGHNDEVWPIAFSPDGQVIATGGWDQMIKLWNVSTGKCFKTLQGHNGLVRTVVFSPNGQLLVSGSDDQSLRLWNLDTSQCTKTIKGYSDRVWSIALSPDNCTLASSSDTKIVKLWDLNSGKCIKTFSGHNNIIRAIAFSPDNCTLASGSDDKMVKLWNINTNQGNKTLQEHKSWVWSVAFSPDGQVLASGSHDQTVKLWDVNTGQCLRTLQADNHGVLSVAFSPDGQVLASGSHDQTVKLWDVNTGQCLRTLQEHKGWVWSIAFSPDGKTLSSSSTDQTVKLWDVNTGQCLSTLREHRGWVWSVAFSPSEQVIASGSMDRTVKLWNVNTGQCFRTLKGHSNGILSVTFSSKGHNLISSSEDETIRIWDVLTGEFLGILRNKKLYEGMKINDIKGLTEARIATLKTLGAVEHELNDDISDTKSGSSVFSIT